MDLMNPANPISPLNPANPVNPSSLLNPLNPANPNSPISPFNQHTNAVAETTLTSNDLWIVVGTLGAFVLIFVAMLAAIFLLMRKS